MNQIKKNNIVEMALLIIVVIALIVIVIVSVALLTITISGMIEKAMHVVLWKQIVIFAGIGIIFVLIGALITFLICYDE